MDTLATNKRGIGIIGWLAGGAAAVVLVLLTGNRMIEERAQNSAARILEIHAAAEPVVRGSAALDGAVRDLANVVAQALQTTTLQGSSSGGLDAARAQLDAARVDVGNGRQSAELVATLDALPPEVAAQKEAA